MRAQLLQRDPGDDLDTWVEDIKSVYKKTTKEIGRDEDHPYVDSHVLNLWDKRRRVKKMTSLDAFPIVSTCQQGLKVAKIAKPAKSSWFRNI
ncbi:hypothetical protein HPB49_020354 [Dermacentor silvarum]|uniref:Uncharacterized protein n=1 Tax=Dermacentor silvarum TaxID=543639 RepID=A0ACB8CZR9_DERSI|nr:hypothetical protein HPB49_020354 [Dermacentor silvarum]